MAQQRIIQSLLNALDETQTTPPRPGVITLPDWSDEKLDELASSIKIPKGVKELSYYPSMLYYFYNFYFNGILPANYSPHNIVYFFLSSLSYGLETERSYFIHIRHFDNVGFFKFPPALDRIPVITDQKVASAGQHIPIGITAEQRVELEALYFTPTSPDRSSFLTSINNCISNFNISAMSPTNIQILSLTGFLSLLLFRGISKDAIQLARGVNKKLIKEHIHNLAGWPIANSYCPPCKTCVDNCSMDFNKGNSHANKMMTLILSSWKRVHEEGMETHGLLPQVQAALLTHTAGNGLGLIMMLYTSCEYLGVTLKTLMTHTLTEQSSASWQVLSDFLKKYLNKHQPQRTYLWARLISDGYFTEYAARAHPYLAGMFAGIIGTQQTIGTIKQAAWYMQKQHQAEQGYNWGKAVVSKLSSTTDVPWMEEGVEVATYLRRHPQLQTEAPIISEQQQDPFAGISIENNQ